MTGAEQKAKRLEEIASSLIGNIEENERKLEALEELLPKVPVHAIEVVEDSEKKLRCTIHLNDGQKAMGIQLFEAGAMNILFGQSGLGSYAWGLVALDTRKDDDSCSVHLYFDLEYERHSRESIVERDPPVQRSLNL